ncbi:RnfABCDGE type electron transport complex subunit D [Butyrivibrio sp. XBB1001]|uniref:RnfABCDGE type electron transport complex subunit D n=1 Tax=Butyrivibrio sp. XBB1001 TaxID=1280682 RepID=UPI00040B329A|nr:RnfABCDGE type electron transport complex subunit D [Butyrivibrio sp. XBB1001]
MSELRKVSSNPHVRSKTTTSNIMMWVVIALLPAAGFGIYNFGVDALIILLLSVATCVFSEFIYEKALHKPVTIGDLSAVVTGLLLGLNLPSTVPWWIPVLGGVFAIILVKQLFGGLGQNFMNPALGGRCFLVISFPAIMTNFITDTYTGATPLANLKNGVEVNVMDMLIGRTGGTIGETSMLCIAIGAMILFAVGIIDYVIPFTYIISFALFVALFGGYGFNWSYISAHLAGGGLMLGAFFMATDYVTCPITPKGRFIYGLILGILTGIFRIFGANAEGVSYAIIISNLLVPLIEKFTIPRAFGIKKSAKKEAKRA